MNGMNFEATKVALKHDKTGIVLTICIHPDQVPEELLRDFIGSRYGVAMVRINDDETPKAYINRVSKFEALCKNGSFQAFLGVDDRSDAAVQLAAMCGIEVKSELNGNTAAQQKFDAIVNDYETSDPFR